LKKKKEKKKRYGEEWETERKRLFKDVGIRAQGILSSRLIE